MYPFSAKMDTMIARNLRNELEETIKNRYSLFLFGPRQTGKTTLLNQVLGPFANVMSYSFLNISLRQRIEKHPETFRQEIEAAKPELILLDEVQKVPKILDEVQFLIDKYNMAFFISASSARKLKRADVNLLGGRAITFKLDPFDLAERQLFTKNFQGIDTLKKILTYGDLPRISLLLEENKIKLVENLLRSYIETFLEEEIRQETLIRNVGVFGNFLKIAAEMSGKILSLRELSQDIGVTHSTISSYYTILNDCLVIEEIPSLVPLSTRRRLSKSSKYVFFDIGARNAAAEMLTGQGIDDGEWGNRFEQWVGLLLVRYFRSRNLKGKLYYWRDHNGPEVDWVVEWDNRWIPIEVKFNQNPKQKHAAHLQTFLNEYNKKSSVGYLIFPGESPRKITENIIALPWFNLYDIFGQHQAAASPEIVP
jgi:predicted AAA+ superfamily ATPase